MRVIIDFATEMMQFKNRYLLPLEQVASDIFTPDALVQIFSESIRQAVDVMDSDFAHYTNCIAAYPRFDLFLGFNNPLAQSRLDQGVYAVFKQGFTELAMAFYFKLQSEGLISPDFIVTLDNVGPDFLVVEIFSERGMF